MIVTSITNVETSSKCNLACQYCPAKDQHKWREVGPMSMDTFERAMAWVRYYANNGTQRELNLFCTGEPLLNSNIVEMAKIARQYVPSQHRVHFNTNGIALTEDIAIELKKTGITDIDITGHNAYHAAKAIKILNKVGIKGVLSVDFMLRPNNWAGQVDWFESDVKYPCPWLNKGQVVVLSDGRIVTCCFDVKPQRVIGHVGEQPHEIEVHKIPLCKTCHQYVVDNSNVC